MKCPCKGSFLDRFLQPSILLEVFSEKKYGSQILKDLYKSTTMDYTGIDPTGFYRTLKKMEENGLLASEEKSDSSKKPIKLYSLTDSGKDCLHNWGNTLSQYEKDICRLKEEIQQKYPSS